MGVAENKVEDYLNGEVQKRGGFTRKFAYVGRRGGADRILFLWGTIILVEVKTLQGTESKLQSRERRRIRATGARAHVVYGKAGVDELLKDLAIIFTSPADLTLAEDNGGNMCPKSKEGCSYGWGGECDYDKTTKACSCYPEVIRYDTYS